MRVLIADDNGSLAPSSLIFLALWGHEVETARDGLEALRKVRSWRPDLVLAGVSLERMDGLSLTAAIRARLETRHVEVVLASGVEDPVARRRSEEVGAFAWIPLPLVIPDLQRVLARLRATGGTVGGEGGVRGARRTGKAA